MHLGHYLEKTGLNYSELMSLTKVERLNKIYTAHCLTFPYSNFELRELSWHHPLRRHISFTDYKRVFANEHTGGYCFQLAALLKDILEQLNYTVQTCEARVLLGADINDPYVLSLPPTHLILVVNIDHQRFLVDPGLGNSAPRLPILISDHMLAYQDSDLFLWQYDEDTKLYVLEKRTELGWLRLIQTDLKPIPIKTIQYNLQRLACHPNEIPIRDSKTVIGLITETGRKQLIWNHLSQEIKFSDKNLSNPREKTITTFSEVAQILQEEFDIEEPIEKLQRYYTTSPHTIGFFSEKPKKPWTIEFPIDEHTLEQMEKNLTLS